MASVAAAMLSDTNATANYASTGGGAVAILSSGTLTWTYGKMERNLSPLGAGLAADSSGLVLQHVTMTGNTAVAEEEQGSNNRRRRRLQQVGGI